MDMAVTLEVADFPGENCCTEVEHMRFSQEPWQPGLFLVLGTVLFQAVETGPALLGLHDDYATEMKRTTTTSCWSQLG